MTKMKMIWIKFYDHFCGHDELAVCQVMGFIYKEDDLKIVVAHWITDTPNEKDFHDNIETVTIIKSSIIKKKILKM